MDWGGVGGVAGSIGGAGAVIVDGTDVAAIKADARASAEHLFVGGVSRRECEGWSVDGAKWDVVRQGKGGDVEGIISREINCLESRREGLPGDADGPGIVHRCKTISVAMADAFPDSILGCDKIGKTLADEGEPGKGSDIDDGSLEKNINKDLKGNTCDRTGRRRRAFSWRWS